MSLKLHRRRKMATRRKKENRNLSLTSQTRVPQAQHLSSAMHQHQAQATLFLPSNFNPQQPLGQLHLQSSLQVAFSVVLHSMLEVICLGLQQLHPQLAVSSGMFHLEASSSLSRGLSLEDRTLYLVLQHRERKMMKMKRMEKTSQTRQVMAHQLSVLVARIT